APPCQLEIGEGDGPSDADLRPMLADGGIKLWPGLSGDRIGFVLLDGLPVGESRCGQEKGQQESPKARIQSFHLSRLPANAAKSDITSSARHVLTAPRRLRRRAGSKAARQP